MDKLDEALQKVLSALPDRWVFSLPRGAYRRGEITRIENGWQVERFTATQAFHKNIREEALAEEVSMLMRQDFYQLTAFDGEREHQVKISKKGKVLYRKGKQPENIRQSAVKGHNKEKRRLLPEGVAVPVLVDVGIMTQEGRVIAAKRDKYRQINRFLELVDDQLQSFSAETLTVVDFGCGLSTLTFALYHYLSEIRKIPVEMTGLDLRQDLMDRCNAAAKKYGYTGLRFVTADAADFKSERPVDMVVSLHACDTATDQALAKGVEWGAGYILSVPCCQHEVNSQMKGEKLALFTRYGLIKERAASLITDGIRANLLAAAGYKTHVVEFVGFEHTPKNIMIRAGKADIPVSVRKKMLEEVYTVCETFQLKPCLLTLLEEMGAFNK